MCVSHSYLKYKLTEWLVVVIYSACTSILLPSIKHFWVWQASEKKIYRQGWKNYFFYADDSREITKWTKKKSVNSAHVCAWAKSNKKMPANERAQWLNAYSTSQSPFHPLGPLTLISLAAARKKREWRNLYCAMKLLLFLWMSKCTNSAHFLSSLLLHSIHLANFSCFVVIVFVLNVFYIWK